MTDNEFLLLCRWIVWLDGQSLSLSTEKLISTFVDCTRLVTNAQNIGNNILIIYKCMNESVHAKSACHP